MIQVSGCDILLCVFSWLVKMDDFIYKTNKFLVFDTEFG